METTWLLVDVGLAVKKMFLKFESKIVEDSRSSVVEYWISTGNLIAAACIYVNNEPRNGSATMRPKTGSGGATPWKRGSWSWLVRKRIDVFDSGFTTKSFGIGSKLGTAKHSALDTFWNEGTVLPFFLYPF